MSYIARQPNGLLCRFSSMVDAITDYNMTEEEYIELCAERARQTARQNIAQKGWVEPFSRVIEDFYPRKQEDVDEFIKLLREVGDDTTTADDLHQPVYEDD